MTVAAKYVRRNPYDRTYSFLLRHAARRDADGFRIILIRFDSFCSLFQFIQPFDAVRCQSCLPVLPVQSFELVPLFHVLLSLISSSYNCALSQYEYVDRENERQGESASRGRRGRQTVSTTTISEIAFPRRPCEAAGNPRRLRPEPAERGRRTIQAHSHHVRRRRQGQ